MGRAVLPDPLESPRSAASADDLLSQLAGNEIDRLLAEADLEPSRGESAPAGEPGGTPNDSKTPLDPARRPAAARVRGEVSFAAPAATPSGEVAEASGSPGVVDAPPTRAALDDAMASQLNNLFAEMDEGDAGTPLSGDGAAGPEVPPERAPEVAMATALDSSVVEVPAEQPVGGPRAELEARAKTSAAAELALELDEIEARAATMRAGDPDEAEGWDGLDENEAAGAGELPVYLRPLEWMNAPLMMLPDAVREALGKVAILTLANALAVLLYVVIFRRAH